MHLHRMCNRLIQEFLPQKAVWTKDILSGFMVFLLALPLSVGIAVASGFPAMSGLITAAVGGGFVGFFAGSPLSIKGPAAGMIVVILGAVEELGRGNSTLGVKATLAAIAVGGLIQMLLGLMKFGKIAHIFPVSAVHGMLSAIGIIIISKQAHVLLGRVPVSKEPLHLLMEIPHSLAHANPIITVIGTISLSIMIFWPFLARSKSLSFTRKIPAPLIVVGFAILASQFLEFSSARNIEFFGQISEIGPQFLINIPSNLVSAVMKPDFSLMGTPSWSKWLLIIVAVGSIESLLTVKAVDAMTRSSRPSNSNQDLMAVGFGNVICGVIGGLPMIAEVVRSSANINAQAQTRWSNIFHGFFIALFATIFPGAIRLIPTAALSGLLIYTGYNLASPKHWKKSWAMGPEQFAIFMATCITTVATDLLMGVGVGLLCEVIFNLTVAGTFRNFLRPKLKIYSQEIIFQHRTVIGIYSPLTFTNLLSTIQAIKEVKTKEISIDVSQSNFIDCTSMTALTNLTHELREENKNINFSGLDTMRAFSDHPSAGRLTSKKTAGLSQFFLSRLLTPKTDVNPTGHHFNRQTTKNIHE